MRRRLAPISAAVLLVFLLPLAGTAAADPIPGFDLDPRQLEARMDDCLAYRLGEQVASHGFPRWRGAGLLRLHYQYNGTKDLAYANVNPSTGDIISFYTRVDNDWAGCAAGL